MSIEARQIQETLYSYAAILNFTPSPQGLRAKNGACSVQNAQLFTWAVIKIQILPRDRKQLSRLGGLHQLGACVVTYERAPCLILFMKEG